MGSLQTATGFGGTRDTKLKSIFRLKSCLPMAPALPIGGSGDFGTSPFFGQLTTKHCSAVYGHMGYRT
jgi:hypothetical protein